MTTALRQNQPAAAVHEEDLGTFVDGGGKTAHAKVDEVLQALEVHPFLGWDGNVYPRFRVETVNLR